MHRGRCGVCVQSCLWSVLARGVFTRCVLTGLAVHGHGAAPCTVSVRRLWVGFPELILFCCPPILLCCSSFVVLLEVGQWLDMVQPLREVVLSVPVGLLRQWRPWVPSRISAIPCVPAVHSGYASMAGHSSFVRLGCGAWHAQQSSWQRLGQGAHDRGSSMTAGQGGVHMNNDSAFGCV